MNSAEHMLSGRSAPQAVRSALGMAMKKALVIILEDGSLLSEEHRWRSPKDRTVINQTFYSLFDRYLVKVVVDSRHRRRHTAFLTDVGHHAASNILREFIDHDFRAQRGELLLSEEASRFIALVTS